MPEKQLSINEEAAALRKLKEEKDEAKAISDEAEADFKQAQAALLERMEDEGCEGIKKDGINFIPVKTHYGKIEDRRAFIEWAEEEAPELIEPKERKELINEKVRQLLDDGEAFPPGLNFRTQEYISQRAVAKK